MLNVTVQQFGSTTIPSFPTIGISTKPFDIARKVLARASEKVIHNKYIDAFTIILTSPVE